MEPNNNPVGHLEPNDNPVVDLKPKDNPVGDLTGQKENPIGEFIRKKTGPRSIRWRQHSPTRIESFTDSVFAFAVTLIVVSLEVPATFKELLYSLKGFIGFAICFLLMMLIWYDQYMFFRKYGLKDVKTIFLNSSLLFVILLYVYPLKFIFSFLTQGNKMKLADGTTVYKFSSNDEVNQLMLIYGIGFFVIYFIFFLMNRHALNKSDELQLNPLEQYNTRTTIYGNVSMMSIGILSVLLACIGLAFEGQWSMYSGLFYALIGPTLSILYRNRSKKMKVLFSEEEINEVTNGTYEKAGM